jgi:hypothetical protein
MKIRIDTLMPRSFLKAEEARVLLASFSVETKTIPSVHELNC